MGFTTVSNTAFFGGGGGPGGDDAGYSRVSYSADARDISADTWTGLFPGGTVLSNERGMPAGVSGIINPSGINPGTLSVDDVMDFEVNFSVTPEINNCDVKVRLTFTRGGETITFEEDLEKLSKGAGEEYSLKAGWTLPFEDSDMIGNPVSVEVLTSAPCALKTKTCVAYLTRT
ncbi:hypothetical protein [Vibrio phage vB_VmeM-Yong XC32]|nr:hypothetical protein [Vibrio phage vB_VmeM-Yong XC31]QAX96569.1 hypothetical protein [Vibrio phage vB_VmeM-Yong XC32]QAX96887.1 hypothetical protein [Vibrio phage vB_VmeM-Yong MS31]QAX97192.1 hypothetical protein [Vibrio phage vB_VmeM-Yong MS32]